MLYKSASHELVDHNVYSMFQLRQDVVLVLESYTVLGYLSVWCLLFELDIDVHGKAS